MARILIIKTGTTYPSIRSRFGDFDDWFVREMARPRLDLPVCPVFEGEALPEWDDLDGVVVTGSPAMVTHGEDWSERTADWLRQAVEKDLPVLGVCYGHQLLAHALGGEVGAQPHGREMGTRMVTLTEWAATDPILHAFPLSFAAHLTHQESVLALPEGATWLASSELDRNQAFRVGRHAWGVQFHPEFTAEIMLAYLDTLGDVLENEGWPLPDMRGAVAETTVATSLLERFVQYVME